MITVITCTISQGFVIMWWVSIVRKYPRNSTVPQRIGFNEILAIIITDFRSSFQVLICC